MKKRRKIVITLFIGLLIVVFKDSIINLSSNILEIFYKDNDKTILINSGLEIENDILTKELNELQKLNNLEITSIRTEIVRISTFNLYGNQEYFYINSGSVKENDAVINESGLLGIVCEIYDKYSKVCTLNDGIKISILVNDCYGTLNNYEIKDLTSVELIKKGDKVYTSGLTEIVGGLYIGNVNEINDEIIKIKHNVDYRSKYVLVVGEK